MKRNQLQELKKVWEEEEQHVISRIKIRVDDPDHLDSLDYYVGFLSALETLVDKKKFNYSFDVRKELNGDEGVFESMMRYCAARICELSSRD